MCMYQSVIRWTQHDMFICHICATKCPIIVVSAMLYNGCLLLQYASVEEDGERYMTPHDFLRDFLHMDAACFNGMTLNLLTGCVDQTKDGYVGMLDVSLNFVWH